MTRAPETGLLSIYTHMEKEKAIQHEAAKALILEKGIQVKIPSRGLIGLFKKEHKLTIRQSYLGTLYKLSTLYTQVDIDEKAITGDEWLSEGKRIYKNSRLLSRIIAVAYLNGYWKIKLFSGILSMWLVWRLTPEKILSIGSTVILHMNNMRDFISTTRLMSIAPMIERQDQGPQDSGG